jgi:hypothetical protein
MKRFSLTLVSIGALLIASCSIPSPGPTPTPTPTPLPVDVAARAGERMLTVNSLHFIIELSGKLVYLDDPPTLALKRAEGDLERPDNVRAIVKLSSFGVASEVGVIGLGLDQYVTNPLNQQWERIPPGQGWYFDPAVLFDPDYGIQAILGRSDWMFGTDESLEEGEQARYYVLHGILPGERLQLLTSYLIRSGEVVTDIVVSKEDGYVHRIHLLEPDSDPEEPSQWRIEFSAFDEPVSIEAPPIP